MTNIHTMICHERLFKYCIAFASFFLACLSGMTQNKYVTASEYVDLNLTSDSSNYKLVLSNKEFTSLINKQFTNILTGQSTNTVGSFASYDVEKKKVTFAPNFIFENGSVASFKFNGAISDGYAQILNNSELNSSLSFDAEYHFLGNCSKKRVEYLDLQLWEFRKKTKALETEYQLNKNDLLNGYDSIQVQKKILEHEKKLSKIESEIDSLSQLPNNTEIDAKINSLRIERQHKKIELENKKNELELYGSMTWRENSLDVLSDKKKKEKKKYKASKLDIKGFKINWFSLGYQFRHDQFKLYNENLPVSDQVADKKYNSNQLRAQFSLYNWSAYNFGTYYFTAYSKFNYRHNLNDLKKLEITDKLEYGQDSLSRTTSNTYTAYSGEYEKDKMDMEIGIEFYGFLFRNLAALHVYPMVHLKEDQKPRTNFGAGIMVPFKNAKKEKSVINAELYYEMLDVFEVTESDFGLFERNRLGIKFTFPINFNPS